MELVTKLILRLLRLRLKSQVVASAEYAASGEPERDTLHAAAVKRRDQDLTRLNVLTACMVGGPIVLIPYAGSGFRIEALLAGLCAAFVVLVEFDIGAAVLKRLAAGRLWYHIEANLRRWGEGGGRVHGESQGYQYRATQTRDD